MNKRLFPIIIFIIFILLTIFAFINATKALVDDIVNTLYLWLYYVYPSIFIFYIVANCLLHFNIIKYLSVIFRPFIKFESKKSYDILFISVFVGNPTTAALISQELNSKNISLNDSYKLLKGAAFFNPLFIISMITISRINNITYAYLIIVSIFITNIIYLINLKTAKTKFSFNNNDLINFSPEIIVTSISNVMSILINVAGIMVFCSIFKFSLSYIFEMNGFNNIYSVILLSTIEVTAGIDMLIKLNLDLPLTLSIITSLLIFQGISVNFQVYNMIKKDRIKYSPILISRLFQIVFAFILTHLLFLIFIN